MSGVDELLGNLTSDLWRRASRRARGRIDYEDEDEDEAEQEALSIGEAFTLLCRSGFLCYH